MLGTNACLKSGRKYCDGPHQLCEASGTFVPKPGAFGLVGLLEMFMEV